LGHVGSVLMDIDRLCSVHLERRPVALGG
jgi:hypothetical protein